MWIVLRRRFADTAKRPIFFPRPQLLSSVQLSYVRFFAEKYPLELLQNIKLRVINTN